MPTRVQPIGFFAFPGCPGAESQESLRKKREEILEKLKKFLGKVILSIYSRLERGLRYFD
jgi:hypothetical protein